MADWAFPVLTSYYNQVLDMLKDRDKDAGSLFVGGTGFTTAPENSIHFSRANNSFYEKIGGAWVQKILSVAGGGTGSNNPSDIRTNLGLGTMATQNANAVAITGGTITGMVHFAISGGMTAGWFVGDGSNISNINASQLAAGTISGDRFPDPLPVRNAYYLYNMQANNLAHGTVPRPQLGAGTADSSTFLRGDGWWAAPPSAGGFPAGLMALSYWGCPVGWTRMTGWEVGWFIRLGPNPNTAGGTWDHAHGAGSLSGSSHTHGSGSYETAGHSHGGSTGSSSPGGSTATGGSHNHSFSDTSSTENTATRDLYMQDGSKHTTCAQPDHTHTTSGSTSTDGSHSHSISVSSHSHSISMVSSSVNGTSGSGGGGALSGATAVAAHIPPYLELVLCVKD